MKPQANKQRFQDGVTEYITGSYEKVKVGDSIKEVFVPRRLNLNPSLTSIMSTTQKLRHEIIEREGLVAPLKSIDFSVFKKDARDKQLLKLAKLAYKKNQGTEPFLKENKEVKAAFVDRIPNWGIGSALKFS